MALVYIGLGSNIGDRRSFISRAIDEMKKIADVKQTSDLVETEPYGVDYVEPKFMNAVVEVETSLPAQELLRRLMQIEAGLGRKRSDPGAPREIDLDILAYGDETIATDTLTVPHPRMHQRSFVMAPLSELNPRWIHPILKLSARELLSKLR